MKKKERKLKEEYANRGYEILDGNAGLRERLDISLSIDVLNSKEYLNMIMVPASIALKDYEKKSFDPVDVVWLVKRYPKLKQDLVDHDLELVFGKPEDVLKEYLKAIMSGKDGSSFIYEKSEDVLENPNVVKNIVGKNGYVCVRKKEKK